MVLGYGGNGPTKSGLCLDSKCAFVKYAFSSLVRIEGALFLS